ncbi:MAG: amidohydrolase [Sphingomonadales bacterium]
MAKGMRRFFGDPAPIQKNYLDTDYWADAAAFEVLATVHVEVGVAAADQVEETRWLQNIADFNRGLAAGIVGAADLRHGAIEDLLAEHMQSVNFRGIRQIVGRHPAEDAKTGSDNLIDDPRWRMGLRVLRDLGLSFDLQMVPAQYARLYQVFKTMPELAVAICHFGSPWDRSPEGFAHWRHWMARFATLPRFHIKFSGFGMFQPDWQASDIAPFVAEAVALFSPQRCMVGSNFPVDKLYGGFDRIWRALDILTASLAPSDRQALFHDTARRFYKLSDRSVKTAA